MNRFVYIYFPFTLSHTLHYHVICATGSLGCQIARPIFLAVAVYKLLSMTRSIDAGISILTERNALVKDTFERSTLILSILLLAYFSYVIVHIVLYLRKLELYVYNKMIYTVGAIPHHAPIVNFCKCMCAFDTYANVTVVNNPALLTNYRLIHGMYIEGLGANALATGIGDLTLQLVSTNGNKYFVTVRHVIVVPSCTHTCVISANEFVCADGISRFILPNRGPAYIEMEDGAQIKISRDNKLSGLRATLLPGGHKRVRSGNKSLSGLCAQLFPYVFASRRKEVCDIDYAHSLLCHPSKSKMDLIRKHKLITGLSWLDGVLSDCFHCAIGKSHSSAHGKRRDKCTYRGELVFCDIQ